MIVASRKSASRFLVFVLVVAMLCAYVGLKRGDFTREVVSLTEMEQAGTETDDETEFDLPSTQLVYQPAETTVPALDFYVEYRLERERARERQLELLREIIDNEHADTVARQRASDRFLAIGQNIGRELLIENLIRAKGFQDVVVMLNDGAAVAIVKAPDLGRPEVAQVADIISKSTGLGYASISVMAKQ